MPTPSLRVCLPNCGLLEKEHIMLDPELSKQLRLLEIRTDRIVEEITAGAYRSVFRGRGIEFDEVREYTLEDDVRGIDWNVSARMNAPYVKKYVEERELSVLLAVDVSASGAFGAAEKSKRRTASELAALLAFSAGKNGDKVGLLMFSDKIELYVPPRSGRIHTLRLIREMLAFKPQSTGTDLALALREASSLMKKRGIVFLLSDLLSENFPLLELKLLSRKQDVIALKLIDPVEKEWSVSVSAVLEDAESGENVIFNGSSTARNAVNGRLEELHEKHRQFCKSAKVDLIEIGSGEDVLKPVISFFNRRKKRISRRS